MCKYKHRYLECITDQSDLSGPFSLVTVCSLYNLGVRDRSPVEKNVLYRFSSPIILKKGKGYLKVKIASDGDNQVIWSVCG